MIRDGFAWLAASDVHIGSAVIVLAFVIFVGCMVVAGLRGDLS